MGDTITLNTRVLLTSKGRARDTNHHGVVGKIGVSSVTMDRIYIAQEVR